MELCYCVICLLIILCVCYWIFQKSSIPNGLTEIPIESGLPLIGVIHKIESPMSHYLLKLGRKLGPIFRIKLGMRKIIVLNNYEMIKKTLVDDGHNFSGRWISKIVCDITHNSGIIFKDGQLWSTQRSFLLKVLRDFGLGKSKSVEIVQNECLIFLDELDNFAGQIVNFSGLISVYTANIISRFLMNKRFARDHPNLKFIEETINKSTKNKDVVQLILLMVPGFDKSVVFSKLIKIFTSTWKSFVTIQDYFKQEIEDHRKELDFNSEGEDLMDRFLIKQHQLKESTGNVASFVDWQLIRSALELFIAGYETTSTTLNWSCLFMSKFPDIQDKVHKEIIEIIGKERLPTMNDKKSMNYTQAVMDEILRLSSVAPLALIHRTFNDTSINGYYIPKDSLVFPNLYACHVDPQVWENPRKFYPEHFLNLDSNENVKYRPREELIPFGIGKRQCLGESLARTEFFIFFISMIQRFQICLAEELSEERFSEELIGHDGIIRSSRIENFTFKRR